MSSAMSAGRKADADRRRQRVVKAITAAARKGSSITVSGIARQAGVDRTFLYRHRDLLALVHPAGGDDVTGFDPNGVSLRTLRTLSLYSVVWARLT